MRRLLSAGDLVDLVEKNDAALLHAFDRLARDVLLIDELVGLLLNDDLPSVADAHHLPLRFSAEQPREHVLDVDSHLFHALCREDLERRVVLFFHVDFDLPFFELSFIEPAPELLSRFCRRFLGRPACADERRAGSGAARVGEEDVEDSLARVAHSGVVIQTRFFVAHQLDGDLCQVADDRLHVAPDISDFREFRRFDLHER